MANSRQLVACMAELTGHPLSRVVGHMRSLREAEPSLVTNKGRGITAPQMTPADAAALYCAIYASPNIQESASTLLELQKLEARPQGRMRASRFDPVRYHLPPLTLGLERDHSIIEGLAAAITFFMKEGELRSDYSAWRGRGKKFGVYANFEIRSPEYSASLTLGVHGSFSEEWIYGRRGQLDSIRKGQCTEITLRKIAACLKP
jgi:hypothetical protein